MLSRIRRRAGADGPQPPRGGAVRGLPCARAVVSQLSARPRGRADNPYAVHHNRVRRHIGLPCHPVAHDGAVCGQ